MSKKHNIVDRILTLPADFCFADSDSGKTYNVWVHHFVTVPNRSYVSRCALQARCQVFFVSYNKCLLIQLGQRRPYYLFNIVDSH